MGCNRLAEATRALRSFSVHYINFSQQTVFTCLGVSLKLIMHFHLTMKIIYIFIYIIYYVEKDIRLYIIYIIQEPLGIFSRVRAQCYLSSSEEEQPQSCSSSSFKQCHFRIRVRVRVALPSRRRICGSSFLLHSLRLDRPDANGPGLLRAGPSGEERSTPHYMVPVSPQSPQEIGLLTLPMFQGVVVSSEHFSQSLPPRNVAELGGSAPLRGSLEQLDRPSLAGPSLQGTELAALSTPEASLERLVPLGGHLAVWGPLPSVSHWVLPEQTLVL